MRSLPLLYTALTFIVYAGLGNDLSPAKAFSVMMIFNIISIPIAILPLVIVSAVVEVLAVNKRLSKFMNASERECTALDADAFLAPLSLADGHYLGPVAADGAAAVEISNGTFRWPKVISEEEKKKKEKGGSAAATTSATAAAAARASSSTATSTADSTEAAAPDKTEDAELPPTLSKINLSVKRGTVVGVAGPVGCGKTSLLSALINDIPRLSGRVVLRGTIAYCAQEPWIQNASLRQNILFGAPMDRNRYSRVVSACALDTDLNNLEQGDATLIGERGINLSGGQKARVALARACYSRADVYLLDDVLAAVDAEVGAHLWQRCILGLLRERGHTVLFITHHTHTLNGCNHVVQLLPDGTIGAQGSPAELQASGLLPAPEAAPQAAPEAAPEAASSALSVATAAASSSSAEPPQAQGPGVARVNSNTQPLSPRAQAVRRQMSEKARDGPQAHAAAAEADEEDRQRGSVSLAVWLKYLHAIGEWLFTFLVFAFAINTLVTYSGTWWISQWSALKYGDDVWFYVAVYIALSASASVLVLGRVLTTYIASLKASKFLFKAGVDGALRSSRRASSAPLPQLHWPHADAAPSRRTFEVARAPSPPPRAHLAAECPLPSCAQACSAPRWPSST